MIHIDNIQHEGGYYFMLFYLAAILIGFGGAGLIAKKENYRFREFAVIVSSGILLSLIGSKLVMFDNAQWLSLFHDGRLPVENGKSVLGALLGGLAGVWIGGRCCGRDGSVLDLFAISFPLGMAIQKFGCLFAGCSHGRITSLPWGLTYGPGSHAFIAQQQLGLLPAGAESSLPVHPVQVYYILACILIAILVWLTSSRWKSPGGKFIFSILLFLVYRFFDEFVRFSTLQDIWMGMNATHLKVAVLIFLLSVVLYIRERKFREVRLSIVAKGISETQLSVNLLMVSSLVLILSLRLIEWLGGEAWIILPGMVMPLCVVAIIGIVFQGIPVRKHLKACGLVASCFILMSQKADKPEGTPPSYTSFNLTTAMGKYNLDHGFNYERIAQTGTSYDCSGYPYPYTYYLESEDIVTYKHSYLAGGIGVSRKEYLDQNRSLLLSLNIYAGREKETPVNTADLSFTPPSFKSKLVSVNPMIEYDARGIGLGFGGSFGVVGYDKPDESGDHRDYKPEYNFRKSALQARLRLFPERSLFVELLGGYDAGAVGHYSSQFLLGSRFNSDKYLLKAGINWSKNNGSSFVVHGGIQLSSRFWLNTEYMIHSKEEFGVSDGNRAVLSLEYRIPDKRRK